jgi:SAM-dependent methyltransferase
MDVSPRQIDAFLETFPTFRSPGLRAYRATALHRFAATLALLPELPDAGRVRVLEVGGRPYLLATLIEHFRGYDVHVANEPGAVAGEEDDLVTLVSDDGSEYSFPQAHLDIEHEPWPWPDGFFDLVVYCEVIEHLAYDPTHTLVEAHRVLRPDSGVLVLSTPNALAWQYLVGILRGRNPFPPYVGFSPHARHHRLFSLAELRHLVEQVGYEVTQAFTAYDPSYLHSRRLDPLVRRVAGRGWLRDRLDVIYLTGVAHGTARYAYPTAPHAIYTDSHGYGRVTARSIQLHEDSPQLGPGFHAPDSWPGVRWTTNEAILFLLAGGEQTLEVSFHTGPRGGPVTGWIEAGQAEAWHERTRWHAAASSWETVRLALPARTSGVVMVRITVDELFVPAESGSGSSDRRQLGVALREASLVTE